MTIDLTIAINSGDRSSLPSTTSSILRISAEASRRSVTVGEKVRFYYGQANDESWIHIIGGHFDKVYVTGSFHPDFNREYGVETTAVPAGSVTVAEYTFKYPGLYLLVNHKLIRATEKGQAVQIIVEGEENLDIMTVIEAPTAVR